MGAPTPMKIHPLITDSAALASLVERLAKHPFVAVDTEFMRENTYWPELCLIQIASATKRRRSTRRPTSISNRCST
jgi:ribonuclease D